MWQPPSTPMAGPALSDALASSPSRTLLARLSLDDNAGSGGSAEQRRATADQQQQQQQQQPQQQPQQHLTEEQVQRITARLPTAASETALRLRRSLAPSFAAIAAADQARWQQQYGSEFNGFDSSDDSHQHQQQQQQYQQQEGEVLPPLTEQQEALERYDDMRKQLQGVRVLQESILARLSELERLELAGSDAWNAWEAQRLQQKLEQARLTEKQILEDAYGQNQPIHREDLELLGYKGFDDNFVDAFILEVSSRLQQSNAPVEPLSLTDVLLAEANRSFNSLVNMPSLLANVPSLFMFGQASPITSFPIPLVRMRKRPASDE